MQDVVILAGARTAIGDFGGSLKDVAPWELGRIVISEAIKRAGLNPEQVGHVVLGQVIQSEPRDGYVSRIAAIAAGRHGPVSACDRIARHGSSRDPRLVDREESARPVKPVQ